MVPPSTAGFVLAGGISRRMGRDKALLPFGSATLLEHVAGLVRQAARSVVIIGGEGRYAGLGLPVWPDLEPDFGPVAGIATALSRTTAEWNLMVACDMPGLTTAFLTDLLQRAQTGSSEALIPQVSSRLHPLCAVYHRSAAPVFAGALAAGNRRVHDVLAGLRTRVWNVTDEGLLLNVNTPDDWNHAS